MNSIPNINIGYARLLSKRRHPKRTLCCMPEAPLRKKPAYARFSRARTGVKATSSDDRLLHRFPQPPEACSRGNS